MGCEDFSKSPTRDIPRLEGINTHFMAGEFEYTLSETTKYTAEYPNCYQGWRLHGWAHAKLDNLDAAVDSFEKAIQLNSQADNAYVGLGVVHRKKGNLNAARDAYSEAIRIEPDNAEAFSSLMVIEIIEKDYPEAIEHGEKAWAIRKDLGKYPRQSGDRVPLRRK